MTQRGLAYSLLLTAALLGSGCPQDQGEDEPESCEPLETTEVPIKLGHVTAVGKAEDGTLFVVDDNPENAAEHRLFVSDGLTLVRREVSGTGESNEDGAQRLSLSVVGEKPFTLFLEIRGTPTRMLVVTGPLKDKNLDISAQKGDELEVVDASVISGLRARNLPGDVLVEYSAKVESERRLIVTRPDHDWTYEDFRVFFGESDRVEEQKVLSVMRARDGGSTWVRFTVGAEEAEAFFPTRLQVPGREAPMEPNTLKIGGESLEIELLPMDEQEVDGLAFTCLP
jgi:hypothetical protein